MKLTKERLREIIREEILAEAKGPFLGIHASSTKRPIYPRVEDFLKTLDPETQKHAIKLAKFYIKSRNSEREILAHIEDEYGDDE